jgi:hypothetical protein
VHAHRLTVDELGVLGDTTTSRTNPLTTIGRLRLLAERTHKMRGILRHPERDVLHHPERVVARGRRAIRERRRLLPQPAGGRGVVGG